MNEILLPDSCCLCIGLTGLPGAGKGEVANIICEFAVTSGLICLSFSLSEELRALQAIRGEPIDRESLTLLANQLRMTQGADYLARITLGRALFEAGNHDDKMLVIIDSIRTLAEVEYLRQNVGQRFVLFAIDAPISQHLERLLKRDFSIQSNQGEALHDKLTSLLVDETGTNNSRQQISVMQCKTVADRTICNDSTLAALRKQVVEILVPFVESLCLPSSTSEQLEST